MDRRGGPWLERHVGYGGPLLLAQGGATRRHRALPPPARADAVRGGRGGRRRGGRAGRGTPPGRQCRGEPATQVGPAATTASSQTRGRGPRWSRLGDLRLARGGFRPGNVGGRTRRPAPPSPARGHRAESGKHATGRGSGAPA